MPVPDRPVFEAIVATDWGQEVHDYTFAPKGCRLSGDPVTVADNTLVQIPITDAIEDPGGWLANPLAEVPTDGEGLYLFSASFKTDDLDSGASLRCYIKVNGSEVARVDGPGDDTIEINLPLNGHLVLSAGDQLTAFTKKIGTAGASVSVSLTFLSLIRVGAEYGA